MGNKEINNLIAEKVMGWNLREMENVSAWVDENDNWTLKQMWNPSNDIQDAWEVVEKLNCDVKVTKTDLKPKYQVHVFVPGDVKMVFAETAPMAICKGALKAVGIQLQD
ncbi:hypothetical protein FC686_04420 [Bacillus cereus]|uniref:BC1872 family protein n=1 Tax=Bacillus cereus TaxID=1396 RepID=UPI0010BEC7D9|nr:hypothetical protein [Bacillus cereus]MCU5039326.1 hypothetical protein [Bacillus cereus]TKH82011.1 hypothetical protein FC686_04420 [Bacillus cereus]TKJ07034.1 hypothetical protein FC702_06530 [Bacillus cereus]